MSISSLVRQLSNPPIKAKPSNLHFRKKKANISSLKVFIELVEKDLFKPSKYNKIKRNITTEERKALKTIQNNELRSYCSENKGSSFAVLGNRDYVQKIH